MKSNAVNTSTELLLTYSAVQMAAGVILLEVPMLAQIQ